MGAGDISINISGNIMDVSGIPSSKTNDKCSQADLEAVNEDIEMEEL